MCVCIDACLYVYLSELLLRDSPRQVRSHAHTYGAASPEQGCFNHVYSSFRLPFFKYKLHFVSNIFLGFFGTRLSYSADAKKGRVAVNI